MLSRLKLLRETVGISQRAVAESIGVSQQSINKYENHNIEPDIGTLIRIADYFQVSVDYLIGHSELSQVSDSSDSLSIEERIFLNRFRKLNQPQQKSIESIIDNYLLLSAE